MPRKDSKWVNIGFTIEKDTFPLSGAELKKFCENLWIFPVAVNDSEQYEAWSAQHPTEDAYISKLVEWAERKHAEEVKKIEVARKIAEIKQGVV